MPTATLCTDEFQPLGRAESESLGMPYLPIVVVPHPMGGLTKEEVQAKATLVLEEIAHVLTADGARLMQEYRGHYVESRARVRAKPLFA